jgi:hypothetical protein
MFLKLSLQRRKIGARTLYFCSEEEKGPAGEIKRQ